MQEQIHGAAELVTLEAAEWQAAAIGEYERSRQIRHAGMQKDLSARILALTGRQISSGEIYSDGQLAVAGVDGATFRLYRGGDLVLVRECAYCGTGRFESPKIRNGSDLGYAVSPWQPLHDDCEDYSSEELPDF